MSSAAGDISVVYLTCREMPRFEWFADSLARQIGDDNPKVILVDGLYSRERRDEFSAIARGRFALRHVPAKPSPYFGPHRLTRADYFAAASARNTGIVHAGNPYIVFADDLAVLMPGWWAEVKAAARSGAVVCGAYQKHWEMVVEDGRLVSSRSEASGIDSRWSRGGEGKPVEIGGADLFGCSFGAPRALLVEVNGFDELCDSIRGEDSHLGVRLEWTAGPLYYNRRMLTIESEELHRLGAPLCGNNQTALPGAYIQRLHEFGVTRRHVNGAWDSSHMVLDLLFGLGTNQTLGNYYLLSDLDETSMSGLAKRFPTAFWFNRQPLSEL